MKRPETMGNEVVQWWCDVNVPKSTFSSHIRRKLIENTKKNLIFKNTRKNVNLQELTFLML